MGRSAEIVPAAFVDPEALVLFFDALRAAGYRISAEQYIAAQDVVLALAAQGAGAGDPTRLARLLGPIVCATPKQQAEFGAHFGRWADRLLPARRPLDADASRAGTDDPEVAPERGLAQELDAIQRSRRWLRWVASPVAVVLAIILTALYFAFRRNEGTLLVHSSPDRAVVRLVVSDSVRAADAARGVAIDSLGVTPLRLDRRRGTYALSLALPGHRDTTVSVDVIPRTTRDVDVTLRPLGSGTVWFRTRPGGARVTLDTVVVGTTPLSAAGGLHSAAVTEGVHQVRLLLPGFRPVDRTAIVQPGSVDTVDIPLEPARRVMVAVTSTPSRAMVTIDGERVGLTPLSRVPIDDGAHTIRLSLAGHGESIVSPRLTRDTTIDVTLARQLELLVTSQPTGATVTVDGDSAGVTPARVQVLAGRHDVVVNRDAFEEFHTVSRIDASDSLHAVLTPVRRPRQRIAFSEGGDTLVVGDRSGTVRMWDVGAASEIAVEAPPSLLSRVPKDTAYSADRARVAVPNDESVIVGNARDITVSDTLEAQTGHVSSVAFSRDGRFLASGNAAGGIRVWAMTPRAAHSIDVRTARRATGFSQLLPRRLTTLTDTVGVSTGGNFVVTRSAATGIILWNLESADVVDTLAPPHPDAFADRVTISDDGSRVMRFASGSHPAPRDVNATHAVDIWDVDSVRVRHRVLPHAEEVKHAIMRPDGRQVVTVDARGVLRVWDLADRSDSVVARTLSQRASAPSGADVQMLEYSPDGRRLLGVFGAGGVYVWSTDTVAVAPVVLANTDATFAAFVASGTRVVTSGSRGTHIWDLNRPATPVRLDSARSIASVVATGRGTLVLDLAQPRFVQVWNLDTPRAPPRIVLRGDDVRRTARFSRDGRWILTTGNDASRVEVLAADRAGRHMSIPHDATVDAFAMTTDGRHVVTASGGIVRIWNTNGITELADLSGHAGEVRSLAFSPDGSRLASAGVDGTVRIWETSTFTPLDSITPPRSAASHDSVAPRDTLAKPNELQDVAFGPDGKTLAAVGPTGVVSIYDTPGSRWRTIGRAALHAWPVWLALLLLPLPWLAYRWLLRRRATAFIRRQTDETPLIEHITLRSVDDDVFPERAMLRIASRLRRRVDVPSPQLDVAASVTQTLRHGGVFTPAFQRLKVTPEYLALVDRSTLVDQQASFVDELLDRLRDDQVLITRYYFNGDPRTCFPVDPLGHPVTLGALTQQYESHRILLFADARSYFNPLTGEAAGWTELLHRWDVCAFLTPEVPARWGATEDAVARDLPVYHASATGLAELADESRAATPNAAASELSDGPFPITLRRRAGRWIERDPLPAAEIDEMLAQVRAYLSESGMTWLAACAVYPALSWKLTLNLGHDVRGGDGAPLLDADRLLRLSRLPWFRRGYMPDWLRVRLLDRLTPAQDAQVRQTLELLLVTAMAGDNAAFDLEVAHRHQRTIHALAGPLLKRLRRTAAPSDAVRDYVFAEFMSGRRKERLAVRVARVIPALLNSRADGAGVRQTDADARRQRRRTSALWVAFILAPFAAKVAPAVAREAEAAWMKIPESPLPIGRTPRVLDPASGGTTVATVAPSERKSVDSLRAQEQILGPTPDSGATPFRDVCDIPMRVRVRAGWWINSVQLSCQGNSPRPIVLPRRGGDGGAEQIFELQSGERIVAVSGSYDGEYGEFVFSLQFHTDRRSSPVYGNGGPSKGLKPFRFDVPEGRRFSGLVGQSGAVRSSDGGMGDYLVSIGVIHVASTADLRITEPIATPDTLTVESAARLLCSDLNSLFAQFPFDRSATTDASLAQMTRLLAPESGTLWAFQRDYLDARLVKSGEQWIATGSAAGSLSAEFVTFFNSAARLSDFFFEGQASPHVQFFASVDVSTGAPATLTVNEQVTRSGPGRPPFAVQWPGPPALGDRTQPAQRTAELEVTLPGGAEERLAEASGDWALFHLIGSAAGLSSPSSGALNGEWLIGPSGRDGRVTTTFTFRSPLPIFMAAAPRCPERVIR